MSTEHASGATKLAAARRRVTRRGVLLAGLILLASLILASLAAVAVIRASASAAQQHLATAQDALTSGDLAQAQSAAAAAQRDVFWLSAAAGSGPVRLLAALPPTSAAVTDLDHMVVAIDRIAEASATAVDAYAAASGRLDGTPAMFADGRVDLARLDAFTTTVDVMAADLSLARAELEKVRPEPEGLESIASARDDALAQLTPLLDTVMRVKALLPLLPDALGATTTRRYLVTMLNEGEMRASGGAPLAVAVATFDKGSLNVPFRGAVAQIPWYGKAAYNGKIVWVGAPKSPWNRSGGQRVDRFASSNFHLDFRSAGFDLAGAWAGGGYDTVDGVIAIDVTALANVLRRTGPIPDSPYGELTADNLGQKLLIDAYRVYADDQTARQTANQIIVASVLERLTNASSALQVVQALGEVAGGRHLQVWLRDPALAEQAHGLGMDGALSDAPADRVGVFSQNGNSSKADLFQKRELSVNATVAVDGSAVVEQRLTIMNAVPKDLFTTERSGYLSTWTDGSWFLVKPEKATSTELVLPPGWSRGRWPGGGAWVDAGRGTLVNRSEGAIAPGGDATLVLRYHLPAGTMTDSSGHLVYRLAADPQPIWGSSVLTVTVHGPSGQRTQQVEALDRPLDLSIPVP